MALGFLGRLGGGAGAHPAAAGMDGPLSGAPARSGPMSMRGVGGGPGMPTAATPAGSMSGGAMPMGAGAGAHGGTFGGGLLSMGLGSDPLTHSAFDLNRETGDGRRTAAGAGASAAGRKIPASMDSQQRVRRVE